MTAHELIQQMTSRFGPCIKSASNPVPDMVIFTVGRENTVEVARHLFHDLNGRFVITAGTDFRDADGGYLVDHVFSLAADHLFVTVRTPLPEKDLWIDSITGGADIPAANWAEREVQDLLGVKLRNHPDPRRLVLADDWPEGLHPLRRDVAWNENPPPVQAAPQLKQPPEGATVVPIGPFFPVLEEPSYWRIFVEGERVVGGDYRGFYNHRGVEKIADSQLNYNQVPFLAERICGI
ncbi:MAG: NADH-quinone oxidoreductase subunit C [candidate division KSB1 bacterium]|nr:NADH-quinone oxidoreductase subunit C [candidate division KSB1 bacterium]MDZ7293977.1 NADH-quinone oxidoreductase subunit C [candidate division KSB1 bacterium]MDZ7338382.1 NADH-quinone oxidoreductase subunit C [candidate division KSB1 bacterium]MDZ7385313.1 NADH-quinone oxidoreductase subunit C [candidate division KSB1 bacterium]MDZ7392765.1 NADH-quinone oxidoreductase subunit C [candidate division KSB1 bacterium]